MAGLVRRHHHDVAFALFAAGVTAVRLAMLTSPGVPPGIDGGNWLALGHGLFGSDVRPPSVVYPPVVPIMVSAASAVAGPVNGVATVAALSSLAPAVAVYAVLRSCRLGWGAVLLAGLLVPGAAVGEAAAWGGYPQLLGIGLCVAGIWFLDRHLQSGRWPDAGWAGVLLAATLATSHFIGAMAVVAAGVLVVVHLALLRSRVRLAPLALVAGPCVLLIPLYLSLAGSLSGVRAGSEGNGLVELRGYADFVFREQVWFWRVALAVTLVTPFLTGPRRRGQLWAAASSLAGVSVAVAVATGEHRALYLLPAAVALALGFWLGQCADSPPRWAAQARRPALAALALVVAVSTVSGLRLFANQRTYYNVVTRGVAAAADWLRAETPPGTVVAVPSLDGVPIGWWVEALAERPTLIASDVRWLYFADERERARRAARIFRSAPLGAPFPQDGDLDAASRVGARYLLVPKEWSGYVPAAMDRYRARHPAAVALENDDAVVLVVPPSSSS